MTLAAVQHSIGHALIAALGVSVLAFLVVPLLTVVPMSFSSSMVFELIPSRPSLTQYHQFFSSSTWMLALWYSVEVAAGTTIGATCLGTLAALGLRGLRPHIRYTLEAVLIAPRIVPSIVFAVAAYNVFAASGLIDTVGGLVLAHTVIAFPFVVIVVGGGLFGLDRGLEEASLSLGAGPFTTFRRVTFPQIRLAILGSALFAFNVSFDEVIVTIFISGVHVKTLPVKVWDALQYEITPILPAISTVVICGSLVVLVPLLVLRSREHQ